MGAQRKILYKNKYGGGLYDDGSALNPKRCIHFSGSLITYWNAIQKLKLTGSCLKCTTKSIFKFVVLKLRDLNMTTVSAGYISAYSEFHGSYGSSVQTEACSGTRGGPNFAENLIANITKLQLPRSFYVDKKKAKFVRIQ